MVEVRMGGRQTQGGPAKVHPGFDVGDSRSQTVVDREAGKCKRVAVQGGHN